ncbi:MAG: adenylate/guanylate cyclase domain-containing protein [SAR324 cluster bacterium]|nr:adenylate/guanylate cyclase domain-containing protein [SAR324 cluster bacterium]
MQLDERLKGSYRSHVVQELLNNSLHFPLANIILEMLLTGVFHYWEEPGGYILLMVATIQAMILAFFQFHGMGYRLIGNLFAPAAYTLIEYFLEGHEFFSTPYHGAFWTMAFIIGLLQEGVYYTNGTLRNIFTVLENICRTSIILVMYLIFERLSSPDYATLATYFADTSHTYITITIVLLGFIVGFAKVMMNQYYVILQETAQELKRYSEWFLGKDLLSRAMNDTAILGLQRRHRTVLFMDIRGFTSWSEKNTPDIVVAMLNNYFEEAEKIWKIYNIVKIKHTGDEIMAVFETPSDALAAAIQLQDTIYDLLAGYELGMGIGIHAGELVEGMIGSENTKIFDIIGDTVNTAKRLCDNAKKGETLISEVAWNLSDPSGDYTEKRQITAKGKQALIDVIVIGRS